MSEVGLRIVVAMAAGALVRMFGVFGILPVAGIIVAMALLGGALAYRQKAARPFIALAASAAYLVTLLLTQAATAEDGSEFNPSDRMLIFNGMAVFVPLAMPALGAWFALKWESRRLKDEQEVTEESLLQEKLPEPPRPEELTYYDLKDSDV